MEGWNLGIFSMFPVMVTMIGVVLAARFVYLDNRYSEIIKGYEIRVGEIGTDMDRHKDKGGQDENSRYPHIYDVEMELARSSIGEYIAKQKENRRGMWLDLFGMLFIIVMGLITVFGVFESDLVLLVLFVSLVFAAPIIHFLFQMRNINAVNP